MHVGVIGSGARAEVRARTLAALPSVERVTRGTAGGAANAAVGLDAAFVAVPVAEGFAVARAVARRGVPLFLEWPPAVSVRECEALVRLGEEAGVEIGVSRPLRHHPLFGRVPAGWRAGLVVLHYDVAAAPSGGPAEPAVAARDRIADALDLCCALVGSTSVQRIDAEAARGASTLPDAVAFGLRFHSGAYAQVALAGGAGADGAALYAGGGGHRVRADLLAPSSGALDLRAAEAAAFLDALAAGRAPAVTVLDALHTLRLVERLMARLR